MDSVTGQGLSSESKECLSDGFTQGTPLHTKCVETLLRARGKAVPARPPSATPAESKLPAAAPSAGDTPGKRLQAEQRSWDIARALGTKGAAEDFLSQYPNGRFAALARAAITDAFGGSFGSSGTPSWSPGSVFIDCVDCPSMVILPSGGFTMGSSSQEQALVNAAGTSAEYTNVESPQHYVRISSFAAGRYAVTKGEFAAFVRASGYRTEAEQGDGCYIWSGGEAKKKAGLNWRNAGFPQADDHPVVCVSWNDSQAYIQWINRISGKNYRLLSEAEREYAVRGGTQTAFWWGEGVTTLQANYHGDSSYNGSPKGQDRQATVPVNSFSANPFGLYNVHGNVWEWTQDCWHDTYTGAPTDGSAWTTGCTSKDRVLRGGSWYNGPVQLRSAYRVRFIQDGRFSIIGIRIARGFSAKEIAIFSEEMARDKKNEEAQAAGKLREEREAASKDERERMKLEAIEVTRKLKEDQEAARVAAEVQKKLKAEAANLAAEERKMAKAEAAQKQKEEKEAAAALAEQERKEKREAEIARKLEVVAARAELERKKKEEAETARKLAEEKEAMARVEAEKKRLAPIEAARKLKEEQEAAFRAQQERKQKEKEEAEAARILKEKEEAEAIRKSKEAKEALDRLEQAKSDALAIANFEEIRTECELLINQSDPTKLLEVTYCKKTKRVVDEALIRQKEAEVAAAARKQKEKEVAARKEGERQRKEQEDRIKKMAKEFETEEQTEEAKKRILKSANLDITAVDSGNKLVAKISDKHAASIQAAIRPNITFDADSVSGNPAVEIQVGLRPDGTIINASIVKTSGVRSWDTAAARALEKTERLPIDESGWMPLYLEITLRPRER